MDFDVRVSPTEIIEVHFAAELDATHDDRATGAASASSAWDESFSARDELRRTMRRYRLTRSLKIICGYAAFVIAALVVAWCAIG